MIVAVAGAKGGTGKTTVAVTLAFELARRGWDVTLRDFDPQASATLMLGCIPVADPMDGPCTKLELGKDRIRLCPGGRRASLASRRIASQSLCSTEGDVVFVDCPPALGALTITAIRTARIVIVPIEPTPLSIPGLMDVHAIASETEPRPLVRAVFNRVQDRRIVTRQVREKLESAMPGVFYGSSVPEDVRAAEAPSFGEPVTLHAPTCRASKAFRGLAAEVEMDVTKARNG